jgi:ATP-dependent Clp protease ATP-binding subunit ClpX
MMANFVQYVKRSFSVSLSTVLSDLVSKRDPSEFRPNGSQIYHGYQGEGKTISMFYHMVKLKKSYPDVLLVSNLKITHLQSVTVGSQEELFEVLKTLDRRKQYILFSDYQSLMLLLRHCRNGAQGVIFMIDEIHNYFHSHDSKAMPMWVVQVFSQQRKQKLLILGTAQDWDDVIKAIRRQIDNLILCKRIGYFVFHTAIDPRQFEVQYGERAAPARKKGFFFISRRLRDGYDTYQVINSGREVLGGDQMDVRVNVTQQKTPKVKTSWRR